MVGTPARRYIKAMTHPAMIEDQAALEAFCQRAASATFLTVDTEFVREKTYYPLLCLVVASDDEAVAIDLAPIWTSRCSR